MLFCMTTSSFINMQFEAFDSVTVGLPVLLRRPFFISFWYFSCCLVLTRVPATCANPGAPTLQNLKQRLEA